MGSSASLMRIFCILFSLIYMYAKGVKPTNVEGRARLKQKDVDLDDVVVEDTPPSKLKGMRPQENHDVEGSSKVRTRFGSVTRGIKAKRP
ncbi:hypothetical protein RHSIM_Rhsim04G0179000 [Rhododendron simsii]|uniref:Uncharacterized protein n=1 Tax=Rhododendron simsii TaxID=118357 RepID=A0A834H3L9_RHOSS|nr:hypothetical protein RHSIM_Rhsim04G0179000 [Rhododendron simsii]